MPDCPLSLEVLPKPLQKHADKKAPAALRMMGAKGLVPIVSPVDLVTLLFLLSFDDDEPIRQKAVATAEGLPDRIWSVALRDQGLGGEVIDFMADRFRSKEPALEFILLNSATLDVTVARLARDCSQKLADVVRQNELRLLRCDDILRALCANPNALQSTVDGACDFCVRNGLVLLDVPQLVAAHIRVHGVDPTQKPPAPEETAEGLLREYPAELGREQDPAEVAAETDEQAQRKLTIAQQIMKMTISQKVKLATLGNREARSLLLRDSNKLVCMAAVTSPRVTDGEILGLASSRTLNADVLRFIYSNREFVKNYAVKASLVRNPKVPLPTAMKMMFTLKEKDIKDLARDRNVSQTLQMQAKAWLLKKELAAKGPDMGKH